jgi:hypothetical protein
LTIRHKAKKVIVVKEAKNVKVVKEAKETKETIRLLDVKLKKLM